MKTKITILISLFICNIIMAQSDAITNLATIASGLDNPNDIKIENNILYVATSTQLLSYDITQETPVAEVIYTVPTSTNTTEYYITKFNIRFGVALIVVEKINPSTDTFTESNVIRVLLSDTNIVSTIDTSANYISAVVFDGNLLYRIIETETTTDTTSSLIVRDVSITNSTFSTITNFTGVVNDLAVFKNFVLVSYRDGRISYVDTNETSPSLQPLPIPSSSINSKGIQVLKDQLFFAKNNTIQEGFIYDENVAIDPFNLIENTTYKIGGINTDFDDVFIYEGIAYMTIAESGLIVKTEPLLQVETSCPSNGSEIEIFQTDLESPKNLIFDNNEIYFSEQLKGISKINTNTKTETLLYEASKINTDYELIIDVILEENTIYFSSITYDVSNDLEYVSSSIKKIDLTSPNQSPEVLTTSLDESKSISEIVKNNNVITYISNFFNENTQEDINTIFTLNLNDNSILDTGIEYNFNIEDIASIDNIIYITDGNKILKGDLNNLSTPLTTFLDTTDGFIESITISEQTLYLSRGKEIQKVNLTSSNPNETISTVSINGSISTKFEYDLTECDSFNAIAINGSVIYASLSETIVNFNNETLSSENFDTPKNISKIPFVVSNNVISFYEKNVTGTLFTISGNKIKSFNTAEIDTINIENLSPGIYLIKLENTTYKISKH